MTFIDPQETLTHARLHLSAKTPRPYSHRAQHRRRPHDICRKAPLDMNQLVHSVAITSIEEEVPIIIVTSSDDDMEADNCEAAPTKTKQGC
jgi:hypothetical protein